MNQTRIAATALDETPNNNLSLPYGLIRTVSHFLEMVGILKYLRGLKTKGVRLDIIVIALTVYMMHTSNSMNACAEWLKDEDVRVCLGFRRNEIVSQKTIDRAVAILGRNREGIIQRLTGPASPVCPWSTGMRIRGRR